MAFHINPAPKPAGAPTADQAPAAVVSAINGITIPVPAHQRGILHRFGRSGNGNGTVFTPTVFEDARPVAEDKPMSVQDIAPPVI